MFKNYLKPKITLVFLGLENTIAAGSVSVSFGGNDNYVPLVEDYKNEETINNTYDFEF